MNKPLGNKNYGSIPHLPGSRMGSGEHTVHEGQAHIATVAVRDCHDEVFIQEKLDGSNVGVALKDGVLHALTRAGYTALSSPYEQHRLFNEFVLYHEARFRSVLREGERLVGEWLMQAHATRYQIDDDDIPTLIFQPFDLMTGPERLPQDEFNDRIYPGGFLPPYTLSRGKPLSIADALSRLGRLPHLAWYGYSHALDPVEGAVWRVEREVRQPNGNYRREVDFLAKYVRPDKRDGLYLGEDVPEVWNVTPERLRASFST